MQRELHFSPRDNSASPSSSSSHDYHLASSLYRSIFLSNHSPPPDDYFNDASSRSHDALALYLPQIQLHQDLMDRQKRLLSRLRDVADQKQALRQENVNLKITNLDLNNRLKLLVNTVDLAPHLDSAAADGLHKMGFASDNEAVSNSPTSVMSRDDKGGVERVHLPKSISVRSTGYVKSIGAGSAGCSSSIKGGGGGGDCVKPSNHHKFDHGRQKVYVKGVKKEQALELEVYNQGMFKTELCNKWQQTGSCPYGNNCQFAHGIEELRPVLRHPRYKTEVCRMVLNGVTCPYGHRCHFRHSLTDQEQLTRAVNSNYR